MIMWDKILKGLAVITVLAANIAGFILANQADSYESEFKWALQYLGGSAEASSFLHLA